MATGILAILKDVYSDKLKEVDDNYYSIDKDMQKKLAKNNPRFRELLTQIETKDKQIELIREAREKIEKTKNKLFPSGWEAKRKAEQAIKEDYLKLRLKTALNGTTKEEIKKMIKEFHDKDYLADVMRD